MLTLSDVYNAMDAIERWDISEPLIEELTCAYCGKHFVDVNTNKRGNNRRAYCCIEHMKEDKDTYYKEKCVHDHNRKDPGYSIVYDPTPDDEYGNAVKFRVGSWFSKVQFDYMLRDLAVYPGTIVVDSITNQTYKVCGVTCLHMVAMKEFSVMQV